MTHLRSKRLSGPGAGRTTAAVLGLVAALALGAVGEVRAAPGVGPVLPRPTERTHGSASPAGGTTTGGAGGSAAAVTDRTAPAPAVAAPVERSAGPRERPGVR